MFSEEDGSLVFVDQQQLALLLTSSKQKQGKMEKCGCVCGCVGVLCGCCVGGNCVGVYLL